MKEKILIVEDEKETVDLLAENLKRKDYEVGVSLDGEDAIEKVKTFGPDVVILDIVLPKLGGLEVLKWIKDSRPKTFVIIATARKELDDLKTGYSLEADYYITKPYKLEEIFKGIDVMLSFKDNVD